MKDTGYWSLCKECANSHDGACRLPGDICKHSVRSNPGDREYKLFYGILSAYCRCLDLELLMFNRKDAMEVIINKRVDCPVPGKTSLMKTRIYWDKNMTVERALLQVRDVLLATSGIDMFTEAKLSLFNPDPIPSNPPISKVIFNPPATIVFWKDGSKTVVKCQYGDMFDPEKGLAMAFMKKAYGNTGKYCAEVKKWVEPYDEECVKKQWTKFTEGITDALKKMGEEAIIAGDGVRESIEATKATTDEQKKCEECGWYYENAPQPLKIPCNYPFAEGFGCPFEAKTIEELFPGVLSKAESLAKHTIMSTEDAVRRLVNERLKDVEPSLHEYYLGQLEPALAKLKESEEKEKKNE